MEIKEQSSQILIPELGKIFLLGGVDSSSFYSFDLQEEVLKGHANMLNERVLFPVVYCKKKNAIFALGGSKQNSATH